MTMTKRAMNRPSAAILQSVATLGVAFAAWASFGGGSAVAATHYDCQQHGFRTYLHRHEDPGDKTIGCDRPATTGRYGNAANCRALALRRNGRGPVVLGTNTFSGVPIGSLAPARARAAALNQACAEALNACDARKVERGAPRAVCIVIDRFFSQ